MLQILVLPKSTFHLQRVCRQQHPPEVLPGVYAVGNETAQRLGQNKLKLILLQAGKGLGTSVI